MCRSETHIAVKLILTMASRLFRSYGSGTFSTRTSFLPCQQMAFIPLSSVGVRRSVTGRERCLRRRYHQFGPPVVFPLRLSLLRPRGLSRHRWKHSRFEPGLQPHQVVVDLGGWLFAEKPGDKGAHGA